MKFQKLYESITFSKLDEIKNLVQTKLDHAKRVQKDIKSAKTMLEQAQIIIDYYKETINPSFNVPNFRWNNFYTKIFYVTNAEETLNDNMKSIAKKLANESTSFNEDNWTRFMDSLQDEVNYFKSSSGLDQSDDGDFPHYIPKAIKLVNDDKNHINRLMLGINKLYDAYKALNKTGMTLDSAHNIIYKGIKISVRSKEDKAIVEKHIKSVKKFIDDISKTKFSKGFKKLKHIVLADWDILFSIGDFKNRDTNAIYAYYSQINSVIYMPISKKFDNWSVSTIYHEYGHLIQFRGYDLLNDYKAMEDIFNFKKWHRKPKSIKFPSDYAKTNRYELFAEMFAYFFAPKKYAYGLQKPSDEILAYFKKLFGIK
jgi:hypothetical protein